MGIAAIEGYQGSNGRAMDLWDAVRSPDFRFDRPAHTFRQSADVPFWSPLDRSHRHLLHEALLRRLPGGPRSREEVEGTPAGLWRPRQVHSTREGGL